MSTAHQIGNKRKLRVTWFHLSCWSVGVVGFLYVWSRTNNLNLAMVMLFVAGAVGAPIPDAVTVHNWLWRKFGARLRWRKDKGVRLAHPLRRPAGYKPTSKLAQLGKFTVKTVSPNGKEVSFSVLVDSRREFLTLVMTLGGFDQTWVGGENPVRFEVENRLKLQLAKVLSALDLPPDFVSARLWRPEDAEPGIIYNRRRLDPAMAEAAAAPDDDPRSNSFGARATRDAYDAQEKITAMAGEPTYYCCVRYSWPRTRLFGRRVNLKDPVAFSRTYIWKMLRAIIGAFDSVGVSAAFTSSGDLDLFVQKSLGLRELSSEQLYAQRDRELESIGNQRHSDDELRGLISVTSDPNEPGWICVNGTYLAAGYATELNRPDLPAGMLDDMLNMGGDVPYNIGTYCHLRSQGRAKKSAAVREAAMKGRRDNALFANLSNPEREADIQAVVEERRRLRDASMYRASDDFHLAVVLGSSPRDADRGWDDLVHESSQVLTLERVVIPSEIEDIVLALMGVKIDD